MVDSQWLYYNKYIIVQCIERRLKALYDHLQIKRSEMKIQMIVMYM